MHTVFFFDLIACMNEQSEIHFDKFVASAQVENWFAHTDLSDATCVLYHKIKIYVTIYINTKYACNWLPCIKLPNERERKKAKLRWKSRLITILKRKPTTWRYIDETIRLNDAFAYRINSPALQPMCAMHVSLSFIAVGLNHIRTRQTSLFFGFLFVHKCNLLTFLVCSIDWKAKKIGGFCGSFQKKYYIIISKNCIANKVTGTKPNSK